MANADREMVDGLRVRTDVNAPGFGNPAGGPANAARRATPRCRKPVPSKPVMKAMQQLWRANGGDHPLRACAAHNRRVGGGRKALPGGRDRHRTAAPGPRGLTRTGTRRLGGLAHPGKRR